MNLKDFGEALAKLGLPLLGAALPIPGGAVLGKALGDYLGTPDAKSEDIITSLAANAETLQKAKEFEATNRATLWKLQVEAETARILSVNETIRAEAASDHWPTYSWRPFRGFMFGLYIFSFVLLPLLGVTPVILSADLTIAVGSILGIASWFRGKMQADPAIKTDNKG